MTWAYLDQCALIFLGMVALDFTWARYTIACAERRAPRAASYAVGIYGLSGYLTVNYVADNWMLIPLALGAFVGTYASILLLPDKGAEP